MKRKLFLSEDLGEDIVMDDGEVVADDTAVLSNILSSAIKSEWEAVDLYNGIMQTIEDEDTLKVLSEIVSEEYLHIGQLEKLLQDKNPNAENIDAGREHSEHDEDELDDVKIPAEDIVVKEGLKEDYSTNDIRTPITNPDNINKATVVVGLYMSPANPPERYHYEIDPWFRVFTKVKADRLLSPRLSTIAPFDYMSQVDDYAKEIMPEEDNYEEIDNDAYEQLQRNKWKSNFIMPDEPGGAYRWEK